MEYETRDTKARSTGSDAVKKLEFIKTYQHSLRDFEREDIVDILKLYENTGEIDLTNRQTITETYGSLKKTVDTDFQLNKKYDSETISRMEYLIKVFNNHSWKPNARDLDKFKTLYNRYHYKQEINANQIAWLDYLYDKNR